MSAARVAAATADTVAKAYSEPVSTRRAPAGSTRRLWCLKKSTPIMGKFTSASKKVETAAMKQKLPPLLAPAHNMLSAGSRQVWSRGWSRGLVWEDAIAGASIYKKMPARNLILNVDQAAGGDGVEAPPAA